MKIISLTRLFLAVLIGLFILVPSLVSAAPAGSGGQASTASQDAGDWSITTLATDGGSYASFAFGPDKSLHAAFVKDLPEYGLYHSTLVGKNWVTTPVILGSKVQTTSIAVATDGTIHIAYHDNRENVLKHAISTEDGWEIETVDSGLGSGLIPSIKLTKSGFPRIAYWDSTRQAFRYAALFQSGWSIRTVLDLNCDTNIASGTSLVLDSSGEPHITFSNCETSSLNYAYREGSEWIIETVDSGRIGFESSSLALDKDDKPHVGYRSRTARYAVRGASAWEPEVVDETQVYGIAGTSLALDSAGRPQMAYRLSATGGEEQLMHAYFDRDEWHKQLVDVATGDGYIRFITILVGSNGNPHILYWDVEANDLKYATMNLAIGGGPRYLPLVQKAP